MQHFSEICGQGLRFESFSHLRQKVSVWMCLFKLQDPVVVLLVQMYSTDSRKIITESYICTKVLRGRIFEDCLTQILKNNVVAMKQPRPFFASVHKREQSLKQRENASPLSSFSQECTGDSPIRSSCSSW